MKRAMLVDRTTLLFDAQGRLEDAARALVQREKDNPAASSWIRSARRELVEKALEFAAVCQRYLGGAR
jgi:hypothetical protein